MQRERLSSRLGFILLSAGCAIGIGNVWKFPYMVGQNGGGAFVLLYLFFLLVMGIPVMTIEFSLGRASQKSPVRLYQALAPKGSKWYLHGYVAMAGNYIIMMFYTTVAGWMLQYFVKTAKGTFTGLDVQQVEQAYDQMCADPVGMVLFMAIVVILGFFICSFSLQGGLERVTKYMMLALLALMLILAVHSCTLGGAKEGLTFYLKPDLGKMMDVGIGNVVMGAMTQAFFTLSLGMGGMAIFGSYIDKKHALLGESINVALLDTFVAVVSGLIIFPACFFFFADFQHLPVKSRFLASVFQSVTPRTAGFNTVDITMMTEASKVVMILLMLIGGSPGSTAGGMKTTTFAVLLLNAVATFKSQEHAGAFGRRIDDQVIKNAASIAMLYFMMFLAGGIVISTAEGLPILGSLFEAASAMGTVGLTLGITPSLHKISLYVLILLMYMGRVRGLTFIYAVFSGKNKANARFPMEKVMIG